jgi:glycosyltransferase involved in cell wall biosynthesis
MKVLLLNQFFHPASDAVAQLAADLCQDLAAAGHEVTVLTARGAHPGGRPWLAREDWHGVRIVRVGATRFGKGSLAGRVADYATFYASAFWTALRLPRHDVVLATTAPPLVATIGAALRAVRGSRFVYWMQDLYPELAVAFGLLSPRSPATWLLERVSRATLRRADAVVVPGEAMAGRLREKGVDPARLHVIPNWADGEGVRPVAHAANAFRQGLGLEGKRIVLYSGNMGRGHDLSTLLEVARRSRERADLAFVFIGGGAKRAQVAAAAAELPSVKLLPFVPRSELARSLSAGDVHVVSQDPATAGLMEPSKLYGIMAAGRPVLYVGPATTEVAGTILREGIGAVVPNGDAAGAWAALQRLLEAGPAAAHVRAVFERGYDRKVRTEQTEALLRVITGQSVCVVGGGARPSVGSAREDRTS